VAETTGGLRRPLANASLYSLVQRLLGADGVRRHVLEHHLRSAAAERILDLGCGPGDILELLPEVRYVGVDISPAYIAAARARFGERGRFICADVQMPSLDPAEPFDAVISIGLLHHLDDVAVDRMAGLAARLLTPNGRLVTIDPGVVEGQPRAARWLIARDRGRSVRSPAEYRQLASVHFGRVDVSVRHDLARVPYTHVVLECRDPLN
jgi:SAM-dependent methyltransferase